MTATALRNDGQNMIEKRCGDITYELKISDAVARGILKLPIYITARYIFEEDIKDIEKKLELVDDEKTRKELEEKLKRAKKQLENAIGLKDIFKKYLVENGKYLAFCNPGDNLEEIIEKAKREGWFDEINNNQTLLSVESSKEDSKNKIALRRFLRKKGKDLRILLSKNMLNEGIHDEEITGEIMLRPTKSYIVFVQQLGRILFRDIKEPVVVLDLVNNIHYFKEFKLEVQRIIKEAVARGDKRYDPRVLEQFKIIEQQEEVIKSFEEIEDAIEGYLNRTVASDTLKVARILSANGVDLTKIKLSKVVDGKQQYILLGEIKQEGIDIGKIIEENNLDSEFPYGKRIEALRSAYRGKHEYAITEIEKREAEELKLVSIENKSAVAETLEIANILQESKVDLSKIQLSRRIGEKNVPILLGEIEQKGIDIGRIIEEHGLDRDFPYGSRIIYLREIYKGIRKYSMTESEAEETLRLGLIQEESKSAISELLEVASILQANGVDLGKVKIHRKANGKAILILLGEIKQDGIDIGKIIEENGLDPKFKYGLRVQNLRKSYNGTGTYVITEAEKQKAVELGIIRNRRKVNAQEIGQATFDAPVEACDDAQAALENLKDIQIEGGIAIDE